MVRLRRIQITVDGKEETAIGAYWVSDGIDRCLVGFLARHMIKQAQRLDGRLAQVVEIYKESDSPAKRRKNHRNKGIAEATLIDYYYDNATATDSTAKKARRGN